MTHQTRRAGSARSPATRSAATCRERPHCPAWSGAPPTAAEFPINPLALAARAPSGHAPPVRAIDERVHEIAERQKEEEQEDRLREMGERRLISAEHRDRDEHERREEQAPLPDAGPGRRLDRLPPARGRLLLTIRFLPRRVAVGLGL